MSSSIPSDPFPRHPQHVQHACCPALDHFWSADERPCLWWLFDSAGNLSFAPGACERLEPFLASRIVGQELALRQISDAICDHLATPEPSRPLVLSLHGPPGVGKSMFHQLAAQAMYNRHIRPDLRCPGLDCAGYKVGMPAGC